MRIGLIGGMDRSAPLMAELAERYGHELELHAGHVGGRGTQALESLIERVDLVVIITDLNSHGAAQQARKAAQRFSRRWLILRRMGTARFEALLEALAIDAQRTRDRPTLVASQPGGNRFFEVRRRSA